MKKHHGKIIEEQVYKSGYKKQDIAKKLGITRQTLTNKFKTSNLPIDFILQLGKAIGHDFSEDIPEIKSFTSSQVNEPTPSYGTSKPESTEWKDKYIELLENYNRFMSSKEDTTKTLATAITDLGKELKKIVSEIKK